MKSIFILNLFFFICFQSSGQNIDENGRSSNQKMALKAEAEPSTYLIENKDLKTTSTFTLYFSLPEGKNNGEIKFFNPIKDEELKSMKVNQGKGSIQINTSEFDLKGLVVGLYSDGRLIETTRVKLTQ